MITIEQIIKKSHYGKKRLLTLRQAAVFIPIINLDGKLNLLFQVRSAKLRHQPGDICFPGGHIEATDKSPKDAAVRETIEELGIVKQDIQIIGLLPDFVATLGLRIFPVIGQLHSLDNLNINTDEVEKIFTVPIDWLIKHPPQTSCMQVAHKPSKNFPFDLLPHYKKDWQKKSEHPIYFYVYQNYVIWGLTAQIVKTFIDMIKD